MLNNHFLIYSREHNNFHVIYNINNILLSTHVRLMDRPRWTRGSNKRHVAKTLPEVHGNYYNRIKIYKETNIHYKILTDNMLQKYFLIS